MLRDTSFEGISELGAGRSSTACASSPSGWYRPIRRASTLFGALLLILGLGAIGASSSQAWTPTTLVTSELNPNTGDLNLKTGVLEQAVQGNGSSLAAWEVEPGNSTEIQAQLIKRGGALNGPPITVVDVADPVSIDDFDVTSLGNGSYVFFWVESLSAALNFTELSYRVMSSTGDLGPKLKLSSVSLAADAGRAAYQGISASSGGGVANVSWGFESSTGLPAAKCWEEFSPVGPCYYTQTASFARIDSDGLVAKDGILISREFTSDYDSCFFSAPMYPETSTNPSTGAATVVINDLCRPEGGEGKLAASFSRVSASGAISAPRFISFGLDFEPSMGIDGTTLLSLNRRLYRIPSKKGLTSRPLGGALDLGADWSVTSSDRVLALPRGQAILVRGAEKRTSPGSKLTKAIWGRLIRADGSFGKPQRLFSWTFSPTGPGTPDMNQMNFDLAVGLGRGTGTLIVTTGRVENYSKTDQVRTMRVDALAINRRGGKVPGSQQTLGFLPPVQGNPSTEWLDLRTVMDIAVSRDGTASALILASYYKQLKAAPFSGGAEAGLLSSKLFRNPKSCDVTPSRC